MPIMKDTTQAAEICGGDVHALGEEMISDRNGQTERRVGGHDR
jgi:hypothetical protein